MPGAVRRTLADPPHITPVHCVKETLPDALTGVKAFALPTLLGIFSLERDWGLENVYHQVIDSKDGMPWTKRILKRCHHRL